MFFYVFFSFNDNTFDNSFLTRQWFIIKNRWILIWVWNKRCAFICRKQPEQIRRPVQPPNHVVRNHVVVITILFILISSMFFYVFFSFNDNTFDNSFLTRQWFIIKNRWILIWVWNKRCAFICRKQPEQIRRPVQPPNHVVRHHVVVITILFILISSMFFYVFFSFNDNTFDNSFLTRKWFIIEYRWILICVWNKRCASICRQAAHSNWVEESPSPEDEVRDQVVVITVLFILISSMIFMYSFHSMIILSIIHFWLENDLSLNIVGF
jgi:hypothetical protein